MRVVILSDWNRPVSEAGDSELVDGLLDSLRSRYPNLKIITAGTDRGVPKLVKLRCMPIEKGKHGEFDFIEYIVKIYIRDTVKYEMSDFWRARNDALLTIGEEFHLFLQGERRGQMFDFIRKIEEARLPYALYLPGVDTKPKIAVIKAS